MKSSYRGNSGSSANYINASGFKGKNEGTLANILKTGKGLYNLYKSLPAYYRYHWFGDESAFAEDQNTPAPTMDEYGDWAWKPKSKDDNAEDNTVEPVESPDWVIEGEFSSAMNDKNAYDAWQEHLKTAEEMQAATEGPFMTDDEDTAKLADVMSRSGSGEELSQVAPEEDNIKAWQKFLNENADANLKVDGIYGPQTKAAVEKWVAENPNYINEDY